MKRIFPHIDSTLSPKIKEALEENKKQESLIYYYSKQDAMKNLVSNIFYIDRFNQR